MRRIYYIPILAGIIGFSSCSVYKNSQTPDDLYSSPSSYNNTSNSASNNNSGNPSSYNNGDYYSTPNDNYVHMRVQDPNRWAYFDDYNNDYYGGYGASCFGSFGYFMYGNSMPWLGFGYWSPMSYMNSYYTWNGMYNPYYGAIVVTNPKLPGTSYTYSHASTFNPGSYSNTGFNRGNMNFKSSTAYTPSSYSQTIKSNYNPTNSFYNNNAHQPFYRTGNSNGGSPFSTQPTRSYTPSSSHSFGGSSGSSGGFGGGSRGGGGGMSRPGR